MNKMGHLGSIILIFIIILAMIIPASASNLNNQDAGQHHTYIIVYKDQSGSQSTSSSINDLQAAPGRGSTRTIIQTHMT